MTEREWRSTPDVSGLRICYMQVATERITRRKATLFASACLYAGQKLGWGGLEVELTALVVAERFVEGQATTQELLDIDGELKQFTSGRRHGNPWDLVPALYHHTMTGSIVLSIVVGNANEFWQHDTFPTDLMREIFGNPFRQLAFDPAWRTSDAVAIATGIYDSRDFTPMPILADALQDAGCNSDDILNHLRNPHATHVRGCWALDLVLGKE